MNQLTVRLPEYTTDDTVSFMDAAAPLVQVSRELSKEYGVIIHGSTKPVSEWNTPLDYLSVAWDTDKQRGRIEFGDDTLYLKIETPGELSVESVVEKIRKACTDISILEG